MNKMKASMSDSSTEAMKNAAERSISRNRKSGQSRNSGNKPPHKTLFDLKRKNLASDLFKSQRRLKKVSPVVSPNAASNSKQKKTFDQPGSGKKEKSKLGAHLKP